jgi:UDP-N-acetylglucosamine 2-epimerase (hydrolysing)
MIEKLLIKNNKFKILPSMRFEYFLRALQNSMFIIGNSSSGIKEAPFFGVPSINVGTRQFGRANLESISNVKFNKKNILSIIKTNKNKKFKKNLFFGKGDSSKKILKVLSYNTFWNMSVQKIFSKY